MVLLETERLVIRDNIPDDLEDFYELLSDDGVTKFIPGHKVKSIEEARARLQISIDESISDKRTKYFFSIIEKQTNEYIGTIGYLVEEEHNNEKLVDLGYLIKKKYWNNGYTTEAAKKVIEYAFLYDNVIKIKAGCLEENFSSEKIMINCGLIKEGHLREQQFHEGKWKDRVIYGILKSEWEAK